jgi:hypothetical protein
MYDPEEKKWEAHTDEFVGAFTSEAQKLLQTYPDDKREWATRALAASLLYTGSTILVAEIGEDDVDASHTVAHEIIDSFFASLT